MTALEQILAPALDAYEREVNRHVSTYDGSGRSRCFCGWEPKRTTLRKDTARATGLHIGAAARRASKICDEECARLLAEARVANGRRPILG